MRKSSFILSVLLSFFVINLSAQASTAGKINRKTKFKVSQKTGNSFNTPDSYMKFETKMTTMPFPPGMAFVPTASYVMGTNNDIVSKTDNAPKRRVSLNAFYMDKYEVSNIDWREYIAWMTAVYGDIDPIKVLNALPDETVWRKELAYNEPYVESYYSHISYSFYPVVGVTWKQAEEYCVWRTDRVNENQLVMFGYIDPKSILTETINTNLKAKGYKAGQVNDSIERDVMFNSKFVMQFVSRNQLPAKRGSVDTAAPKIDGLVFPSYRLPTEAEWEYAAYGNVSVNGSTYDTQSYPWKGETVRNMYSTGKNKGTFMANFVRGRGEYVGVALNNTATVPVDFFYPNGYGLFNMAGNVNEWVKDVYRATTAEVGEDFGLFRGTEFPTDTVNALTQIDKLFPQITAELRDSLLNAYLKERTFVSEAGDKKDYKDGDKFSVIADSILRYENANPIEKATMISNNVRVYKGGSWKDRAMWLNPAERRALAEDKCSNDIGFRCAMDRLGSITDNDVK